MKKALVVFLILAVAGGLFAQTTVGFSGNVQTGLAVGLDDRDGDNGAPKIGFIRNKGEHETRADFLANIKSGENNSTYGTFGGTVGFRFRSGSFLGTSTIAMQDALQANVFWTPNSFVYIHVGTGGPGGYGSLGAFDRSQDTLDGKGLKIQLTPIAGLYIGAHVLYGAQGGTATSEPANGSTGLNVYNRQLLKNTGYKFGAKYTVPSLVAVAGNLYYNPVGMTNMNFTNVSAYPAGETDLSSLTTAETNFAFGANFLGLSGLGITALAADVSGWNFGSDYSFLGAGLRVAFATGPLSLGARAQLDIWMGETETEWQKAAKDFMPMVFRVEAAYQATPIAKVGAEAQYVIGRRPSWNYRNAGDSVGIDNYAAFGNITSTTNTGNGYSTEFPSGGKGSAALAISPWVSFAVGPEIILGYNLQMDMSDDKPEAGKYRSLQHLIYAGVNLSF